MWSSSGALNGGAASGAAIGRCSSDYCAAPPQQQQQQQLSSAKPGRIRILELHVAARSVFSSSGLAAARRRRETRAHGSSSSGSSGGSGGMPNEDGDDEDDSAGDAELFRKELERIVDKDEASFSGRDLAMIIRRRYGKSYDVQLIKREFMGRQLLAMNVMWKYCEQRSFPLSEEEYLLRLDDVANALKCWGAVAYVRRSIENTKERPRIGKAVSIVIDMDDTGGRANEWINR